MSVPMIGSSLCLLLTATSLHVQSSSSEDRDFLTRDVTSLIAPGCSPGPLNASGDAFVVLTGKEGKGLAPLFVATKVEKGRAIAGGHEGFFSTKALANPSNGRFLANALTWLARKPLDGMRVGLLGYPSLTDALSKAGAVPSPVNVQTLQTALANADVICMTQGGLDDNPSGQIAVMRFVKSGHGLLIAGPAWGWLVTHPGKDLLADQTANRMLFPYGICFEDGGISEAYTPENAGNPLLTSQGAIVGLTKGGLSLSDIATATSTVERSLAHQSAFGSTLGNEIANLAGAEPGGGIPSEKTPITTDKPFSRLKAWIDSRRYTHLSPREMKADPSAAVFPGAVDNAIARTKRSIVIDTSIPSWHGTAMYAAPGETVYIQIPENATGAGLSVRIGAHTDTLWELEKWPRFPEISMSKPLTVEDNQVASSFGGLIYIEVPYQCRLGRIEVEINHAVPAAHFVRGKTSESEWKAELQNSGAPWAELEGNQVILIVPISSARKVHNAGALMAYWDEVMSHCYQFYAAPQHPRPERYCPDVEISAGYMHSGYPIMTHMDVADTLCDLFKLRGKSWTWGFYHEMGHNFQQSAWTWDGCGEVTNNLFSLYGSEKLNGVTPATYGDAHPAMAPPAVKARLAKYVSSGAHYETWMSDPFLALSMFAQLREQFGWDPFTRLFAQYWALTPADEPRTDIDKRDGFMVRFSRLVGRNLGPFFQAWGVPTTDAARSSIASLPSWMPKDWPK